MIVRRFEPAQQFFGMSFFGIVRVIAVEKGDAFDVVGDFSPAVDEAECETAAAAVAGHDNFEVVRGKTLSQFFDELWDAFIFRIMRSSPDGPGFFGAFEIDDDYVRVGGVYAEPARLGANV